MKKKILILMVVFLLVTGVNVFAGAGDFIVKGKLGVGTTGPASNVKLQVETPENVWGINLARSGTLVGGLHSNSGILTLQANSGGAYVAIANNGNVGIGTTIPTEKLEVKGNVKAQGWITGDITFQKDGEKLWRMFEDEDGLYLESVKTGKVYKFVLQEVERK